MGTGKTNQYIAERIVAVELSALLYTLMAIAIIIALIITTDMITVLERELGAAWYVHV